MAPTDGHFSQCTLVNFDAIVRQVWSGTHMPRNPKRLLLLDATGALITFISTEFVLASRWVVTGVPSGVLHVMAAVAAGLCVVASVAYLRATMPAQVLRALAIANALYGLAVVMVCVVYWPGLSFWGTVYFSVEVVVLAALAGWEWNTTTWPKPADTSPSV